MKIDSYNIGMESVRTYRSVGMDAYAQGSKRFELLGGKPDEKESEEVLEDNNPKLTGDSGSLKQQFEALQLKGSSFLAQSKENEIGFQIRSECIDFLLALLFGRKVDASNRFNFDMSQYMNKAEDTNEELVYNTFTQFTYHEETEMTTFNTKGTVVTEDGREIDFNIEAMMSRSFMEYTGVEVTTLANLTDPLVINLKGNVADVSDQKFMFDIDGDGVEEQISKLIENSGFLALDLNEDGEINDGSELFGTKSGNGFEDLAKYDEDGNGWIDESDEVFDKLKVWYFDSKGDSHLIDLREAGVGAIFLGSVKSDFSINDIDTNETQAMVRRSGMFLFENGESGIIQQVDMAAV